MNEKLVGQKGEYMNELQIFKNVEFGSMRIVTVGDEIYFVGKDVADVLGYVDGNKAVAMHVDDEDKKLNDKTSPSFGQRGATLINVSISKTPKVTGKGQQYFVDKYLWKS